jgi:hypothetical protein
VALCFSVEPKYKSDVWPRILFKITVVPFISTLLFQSDCTWYYDEWGEKPGKLTDIAVPAVKDFIITSRLVPVELRVLEAAIFNGLYLKKSHSRKYVQQWKEYSVRNIEDDLDGSQVGAELVEHTYLLTPRPKTAGKVVRDEIDKLIGLREKL